MSSQLQVSGEAKIRDIQGPVVANSGVITALDGAASQYVRGDGTLADFPTSSGGGSSVSYYLNSSVSQGTIGGVAYRELSKDPIIGAGTDIPISANGYVANYLTDANDPDVVLVPGGNFNCEFYFSVSNDTGNPTTYAELYKYDGTTFTLLGTSAGVPESINQGTTIAPYYFAIPVATAALSVTDRLAIRIYVNVDGRTVTLHTENGHLCQVVTTLSKGMVSLNNLTDQSQYLATGTSGTNFAIVSSGDTHTFNLPVASVTNTGKLSSTDWSTFNNKQNALTNPITGTGANGQVTFFNGTTSVIGSNNFFWDNTNSFLGVGTNVPSAGITSFSATAAFQFKAAGTAPAITFSNTLTSASLACVFGLATSNNHFIFGTAAGDMAIANQSTSAGAIVFGTGTTEKMRMTSAGTFSIGNTNSTYNLDVTGTGRFTTTLTANQLIAGGAGVNNAGTFTTYDGGVATLLVGSTGNLKFFPLWNPSIGARINAEDSAGSAYIPLSFYASNFYFHSNVNFNSTIGNGTYTYTLPSATGTLALTSNLSAYLPLTGGTLTGALSGTSATFSGSVSAGTNGSRARLDVLGSGTANTAGDVIGDAIITGLSLDPISTANGNLFIQSNDAQAANKGGSIAFGARFQGDTQAAGLAAIKGAKENSTSGNLAGYLSFYTRDNSAGIIERLRIASTGAATFSSSVTANGLYANAGNSARFYRSANDYYWGVNNDSNNYLNFGTFAANGTAYGTNPKMILLDNGNVGIGTSPSNKLTISNNGNAAIAFRINDTNANASFLSLNVSDSDAAIIAGGTSGIPFDIYTGGSIKMRITSGGNVGIGTSSPSGRLTVAAASSGESIRMIGVDTIGDNYFTFYNTAGTRLGYVGYGYSGSNTFDVFNDASDPMIFSTAATEKMRIRSDGAISLGSGYQAANSFTYFPNYSGGQPGFQMYNSSSSAIISFNGNTQALNLGNLAGGVTTLSTDASGNIVRTVSDERLKTNVENLEYGLETIMQLRPIMHNWVESANMGEGKTIGFIAQEVEVLIPEIVNGNEYKSIDYPKIVAVLVKGIQELEARIVTLESKIN